jgi:hypothetical protein
VRITRTVQIDFDQAAERQRLTNSFSSATRAVHLAILDHFASGDWRAAWDNYLAMKREDREAVHILIIECLNGYAGANGLEGSTPKVPQKGPYYEQSGFNDRVVAPGFPTYSIGFVPYPVAGVPATEPILDFQPS